MKKTKKKAAPAVPPRSVGRPRSPRGGFDPVAIRTTLAARGLTGAWLIKRLEAEGYPVDRRRVYGWMRGADIPSPPAEVLKAIAGILGVTQAQLRDQG